MRTVGLPEIRYDRTATRPDWADLPATVRDLIQERLGGPMRRATVAGGGFTRGFAALVETASDRAFVKASGIDYLIEAYHREAMITSSLPSVVTAARPRWTATAGNNWYVLCLDPIDGRVPSLPWDPADLSAALDAWAVAAASLRSPPAALIAMVGPADFGDITRAEFNRWRGVAAHRAPLPPMPRYAVPHLAALADLEGRMVELSTGSTGLMHCDLRLDNILLDRTGAAWLCDWNHTCTGPAWFDTLTLLITAYASGLDADGLFATHPTVTGRPTEAVRPAVTDGVPIPDDAADAGLAALAGFYLGTATQPSDASPSIAAHRLWYGRVALDWLAARQGWRA